MSSGSPSPAPDSNSLENTHVLDSKQRESSDSAPSQSPKNPQRASEEVEEEKSKYESPTLEASISAAAAPAEGGASASSSSSSPSQSASISELTSAGDWQAVWSSAHNAYYFYNAATQETTWMNPLQPAASTSTSASPYPASAPGASFAPEASGSAATQALYDMQAAAAAQGIDPSLAFLDPSFAAGSSTAPAALTYTAKFNAHTGTFARPDARDPTHLSEYERAKRMSEFYFDVNAWEKEVEMRKLEEAQEQEGKKRKRPTKKDLERFKEQKRLKKIAKTAWLRT